MENVPKIKEEFSGVSANPENSSLNIFMKRDHDSLDDFEHLEHDTSPIEENKDMAAKYDDGVLSQTGVKLVDVPRAAAAAAATTGFSSIDKLHDVVEKIIEDDKSDEAKGKKDKEEATKIPQASIEFGKQFIDSNSEQRILDKPINNVNDILGEINLASAHENTSKTFFHPFQPALVSQGDPKAASIAFMDSERSQEIIKPEILLKTIEKPDDTNLEEKLFGVLPDSNSAELQRALEAQVAESSGVKKSESVEEVFEDLAQAALKMPEVRDIIDPKDDEDLFGISGLKSSVQVVDKPEAKIFDSLNFRAKDEKLESQDDEDDKYFGEIKSSVLPEPQKSPEIDFVKNEIAPKETIKVQQLRQFDDDSSWNVIEKPADKFEKCEPLEKFDDERESSPIPGPPTKSLPPIPRDATTTPEPLDGFEGGKMKNDEYFERKEFSSDFIDNENITDAGTMKFGYSASPAFVGSEIIADDDEFESGNESSCPLLPSSQIIRPSQTIEQPAIVKNETNKKQDKNNPPSQIPATAAALSYGKDPVEEIAPKEIFREMGLDAWFNPERLNPKVEALIYWRDPKKSGVVFGAILGVLLSLAYFSLISVLAYLSLVILTSTVAFRIYKTVLQAVQKTSDGHPFKDVLDVDLTLPAEKVHDVADVAVAHANAAVAELRRLFLVEDLVDSLKFGVLLWCLTYLGAWFNGMTLIIIGVVALFSLPKVYETNKTQIDQNLDIVRGKVNDLTAKVKAAIPLGKKSEPAKEE